METPFEGGCACRAVRYRLESVPPDAGWCHCRLGQRVSGAPAMVFSTIADIPMFSLFAKPDI